MNDAGSSPVYMWTHQDATSGEWYDVRILLIENVATNYLNELLSSMDPAWFDPDQRYPTSALMAWQQNDPAYSLPIQLPPPGSATPTNATKPAFIKSSVTTPNTPTKGPVTPKPSSLKTTKALSAVPDSIKTPKTVVTIAPHHHNLRKMPPKATVSTTDSTPTGTNIATNPIFEYRFFPTNAPAPPSDRGSIPMGGVPQDILFAISLKSDAYEYLLTRIEISIPYGAPPDPNDPEPIFTLTNFAPTGTFMLSYLRFNPLLSYSEEDSTLVIHLMPRSTKGYVPVSMCQDLSFVLTGVPVNTSTITPYNIAPVIGEHYQDHSPYSASGSPTIVMVPRKTGS